LHDPGGRSRQAEEEVHSLEAGKEEAEQVGSRAVGTVLVTGSGRGIGRATALKLAREGWDVIAGVRRAEDGEALAAAAPDGHLTPVVLDVTDASHLAALAESLPARLDAVVANAGIVVEGPIEGIPLDELRRQLEVNVVGQVGVAQAVLPKLRESRGRIVFISSVSGRISTPMTGAYNASKFALEGLADSLRIELRPWGIKVIVVQPSSTDTEMWSRALDKIDAMEASLGEQQRSLYARHLEGIRKTTRMIQKRTVPVEDVVETVERALGATRPRARYPVGAMSKVQLAMNAVTPTRVMDAVLARATGVPRKI
jgi:NAD(P)-dependent dehydrogenase (short-subunit alcohol dehydrogenase family)